ncbi:MAG: hypothetical protein II978_08560 [Clostridia bacterium]|nr:hypothetical protein [Clostridia bacterium]
MAYEYSFADNIEYGAEDLNKLVKSLVSSGVADPFVDGVPYNAEKINDIVKTVYSDGVVPDSDSTLKVSKVSDGTIAIAPGLAFFEDGSTIRITEAHQMPYAPGAINYVYLKQDLAERNQNYPVCSVDAPSGDFVLLAEISEYGVITDKRTYAKGKVAGYQSNANCSMVIEKEIVIDEKTLGLEGEEEFEIDMGTNNYSHVFVIVDGNGSSGQMGVYSLKDNTYFCTCVYGDYDQIITDSIRIGSAGARTPFAYLTFSLNGNKLKCLFKWNRAGAGATTRMYKFKMVIC